MKTHNIVNDLCQPELAGSNAKVNLHSLASCVIDS